MKNLLFSRLSYFFLKRGLQEESRNKTRGELIKEIKKMQRRISELEKIDATRKQAEEACLESERKYRNLAESLDELIYRADPETFVVSYVNRSIERIYGYSVEEWLENPELWEITTHPEDKERVLATFTEHQEQFRNGVVEYRVITKDGITKWVQDRISWGKDQYGNVISLNGVMADITEHKQIEALIRSQRDLGLALSLASGMNEGLRICLEEALKVSECDCGGIYLLTWIIHKKSCFPT